MIPANAPAFRLFFNTGKRAVETGAAWPNRDGAGFSINCYAVPLQGRIIMRQITEKPAAAPTA